MDPSLDTHIKSELKAQPKNITHLHNSDFKYGTYRITKPGIYKLKEDIDFNPNSKSDWFPTREQLENDYAHSAFFLGFFSAITIETSHVVIDLNGYCIKQSKMHALQQRFFQTIQLNNSPFILKQGPSGTFANAGFIESKYIWIKNGSLGLTSHYCIHGNNNSYVLIENVKMFDFETGGVAINQADHMVIQNCRIGDTRSDTPVTAMYSVLRNVLIIFKNTIMDQYMDYVFGNKKGKDIVKHLRELHETVLHNYINSGYKTVLSHEKDHYNREIKKYIYNKTGLNDGSSIVGIQVTPKGVAVHAFDETVCPSAQNKCTDEHHSEHIFIIDVDVFNINADPVEVVSCKNGKKDVVGAMGELPNIYDIVDKKYHYRSSTINDAHFWLGKLYNNYDRKKLPISTIAIPKYMIDWAENGTDFTKVAKKHNTILRYGLDIMGHTNKGVMGLRIGGCHQIQLTNVRVSDINNIGKNSGVDDRPVYGYKYEKSDSNLDEETGVWYSGNLAFGVIYSSSKKVNIHGVKMGKCTSRTGKYYEYFYNQTPQIEVNYN